MKTVFGGSDEVRDPANAKALGEKEEEGANGGEAWEAPASA